MGILDDNNLLMGAFNRDPETPRSPESRDRSALFRAIIGIVFGVLWLWGLGALVGLFLGGLARSQAVRPLTRGLATAAMAIGGLGVALAIVVLIAQGAG